MLRAPEMNTPGSECLYRNIDKLDLHLLEKLQGFIILLNIWESCCLLYCMELGDWKRIKWLLGCGKSLATLTVVRHSKDSDLIQHQQCKQLENPGGRPIIEFRLALKRIKTKTHFNHINCQILQSLIAPIKGQNWCLVLQMISLRYRRENNKMGLQGKLR